MWRTTWDPIVFVAMSFDKAYESRFTEVFAPAVSSLAPKGRNLSAKRVDLSSSGDSILTEINDGIAHAQLILADVSMSDRDAISGNKYRNANVLYEVGIALASRRPEDVLLVRDDHDKFLFDVSTIPHATIDFADFQIARSEITSLLQSRLKEQSFQYDVRVERAIARLSNDEIYVLGALSEQLDHVVVISEKSPLRRLQGTFRLLDQELMYCVGATPTGDPQYSLTPIGRVVAARVADLFPQLANRAK